MSAEEVPFVVESVGPTEQRASFRVGDSWCSASSITLRAGVRLEVTRCRFDPDFSFPALKAPAELELVVSKGAVLEARAGDGRTLQPGGNTLQLASTPLPLPLRVR